MSQFSKRANPFRDENGPGDAALGGGTQPTPSGTERCLARGCPLPGTVSDSTKGGGPWTCSAHRRAAPEQWPAISERASANLWLMRAWARLTHDGESVELARKVSEFCERGDGKPLRYEPKHESVKQWAWRLRIDGLAWIETGVCRSTPFGLKQSVNRRRKAAGLGKLAALLVADARGAATAVPVPREQAGEDPWTEQAA